MQIYLVGGAVRDQLLGFPSHDRDWVVVGADCDTMVQNGYQQVGKDFPVFLHPKSKEEYALARTERKAGSGYTGFSVNADKTVTLEQDLERRDLTINAMARDEQGHLHDPFNGQSDIEKRVLRHVSPAFIEDPLRVLRVARFAARYHHLGFHIDSSTLGLMKALATSGELTHLSAERIWQETHKALTEASPWIYFQVLHDCGGLDYWFAELEALWGVPQPEKWHPEIDTGVHALLSLEQASHLSSQSHVRFAALCHDLGKALTPSKNWPSHHGHESLGIPAIAELCQRIKVPNQHKQLAQLCAEYHTHCHRALELKASTIVSVFNQLDAWRNPERFEEFLLVCIADATGRTGWEKKDYPQADYLRRALQAANQVNVKDIIQQGHTGPAIRDQLQQARVAAVSAYKEQ